MEDVLKLYAKPLNKKEPVVCLDEKPVQLLDDARPTIAATRPGAVLKRDYEYVRKGMANVFCVVEPKGGKHMAKVTKNRKGPEFAKLVAGIAKAYARARKIHLVMDNLSTHTGKPLRELYGDGRGKRLWKRFMVHYTPKHGSWLNQAEIEIGLFARECIGKTRIGDIKSLTDRARAWNTRANRKRRKINWGFTVRKARKKFEYNSPGFTLTRY